MKKTVLFVDDSVTVRSLLRMIFEKAGYKVEQARDGQETIQKYNLVKPDLIFLDIEMPKMDGLKCLHELRKIDSQVPIIMLTSRGAQKHRIAAFERGANAFFTKPYREEELLEAAQKHISLTEDELEKDRLKSIATLATEETEKLKKKIQKIEEGEISNSFDSLEKYEAICGAVAHRLKNEFLVISSSVEEIKDLSQELNISDLEEECIVIQRSIEYSQQMLRKLLNSLEMGFLNLEAVELDDLIQKVNDLVRDRLPSEIQISFKKSKSIHNSIAYTNSDQLLGIIIELIQNSINALYGTKEGLILIIVREEGNSFVISLSDNGPGIPVDLQDKLLKEQVKSQRGLGLGLYLCKKVLKDMGGDLKLSPSEKGASFNIYIPKYNEDR